MGKETEFEKRNGREIGNETEFKTRNWRKWETRRDKIHNFSTRKREKQGKKLENYKKYKNKILTRFREMLKTETSF